MGFMRLGVWVYDSKTNLFSIAKICVRRTASHNTVITFLSKVLRRRATGAPKKVREKVGDKVRKKVIRHK
jgi:hypothetical protein